jgi:hypothetical protein
MVRVRTANDIVLSILDFYRTAIPLLDLKPGQISRDLFVDGPAVQMSRLYEELLHIQNKQSLLLSLGSDIDSLASNYGASRKTGSKSRGLALLTFNEIESDIPISKGGLVIASNGMSFTVVTSTTVLYSNKNTYRATASKNRAALDFVGISDEYAVEVLVECATTGSGGNISRYSLKNTTIAGVSRVTNAASFGGGSPSEIDSAYKRRILGIFSGANTGTETGYKNIVLADPDVIDAIVVGPGDTLMTRDGTDVYTAEDGSKTIVSEGSGGKVDIYVFGYRLTEIIDSFIYFDHSNKDDPTDESNDFVLGQIDGDENKTVSRKRIDNIANQELPNQPVTSIIDVSGSSSGSNFKGKSVDSVGRISGNYELVFDTGNYAGSVWGFDRLRWIDDHVRNLLEDITKGKFNSQDPTGFSDVSEIKAVQQSLQIINENSSVSSINRAYIQLSHYPINSVSRVFNFTTGERYVVSNQNPDGGEQNTTGRILISGSTLPSVSDILQVDYTWVFDYSPHWDFDNKSTSFNIREVGDSIDWGYSNNIHREEEIIQSEGVSNQKVIYVTHDINSVVNVNIFTTQLNVNITLVSNRLAVVVNSSVLNVISITRDYDSAELYNTANSDGSFSAFTIFLPTDTIGEVGDGYVTVKYNAEDKFTNNGISGSFNANKITLPSNTDAADGYLVEVNYLADTRQLLSSVLLSNLPVTRNGNAFSISNSNSIIGTQPTTHIYSSGTTIQKNLKLAPSRLKLTLSGSISPGVLTIAGTTMQGIAEGVFIANASGLTQNLSSLIRTALSLTSNQTIPLNVNVIKLVKFEKVQINSNKDVLAVEYEYDTFGYEIKNNDFAKFESLKNTSLTSVQFKLPDTINNNANLPVVGDAFRITFYIGTINSPETGYTETESISFTKSGTLYTQKTFAFIDSISKASGFISGENTSTLSVAPQNQPAQGSRYSVYYDYLAPKQNERITIRYNQNQIINDNTFAIASKSPIGADVLVKAAIAKLVNITIAIVVSKGYENSSSVVGQNVKDSITNALNATTLNTTIDESDFVNVAYTINGVDRARVLQFNVNGQTGRVLSITSGKNEYIQANEVTVQIEER